MSSSQEPSKHYDFIVVGGGIVGSATAYKLSLKYPEKTIALVEKEKQLSRHQTGRNSGVIHSGIYYSPGSLKAKNCRNGREQLVDFAEQNGIRYEICGKLILATSEKEIDRLHNIYERGLENQTPGIRYLLGDEIKEKEPYAKGLKAIWVPTAGIIDYPGAVYKFVELMLGANEQNRQYLDETITSIERLNNLTILNTPGMRLSADQVIVCAGLQSDRLAKLDGLKLNMQIVGFRGDYYELKEEARFKVKHLIYPVPDPRYPFLGVHFTPMIGGEVECGPNAVFTFKREGYTKTSFSIRDSLEALSYKGTWKLFMKNWAKGLDEYRRAFSKKLFVDQLQEMIPSLEAKEVSATRSGVRAQAVGLNGEMIDDFVIRKNHGVIHVINAPSPAATACLAIADEIISELYFCK